MAQTEEIYSINWLIVLIEVASDCSTPGLLTSIFTVKQLKFGTLNFTGILVS